MRLHVFPINPADDKVDLTTINAIFIGKYLSISSSIFSSDGQNLFFRKIPLNPLFDQHVSSVGGGIPFDYVSRVKTSSNIACMQSERKRPFPIGKIEGQSMGRLILPLKATAAISGTEYDGKWPKQTLFRVVGIYGFFKPLMTWLRSVVKLIEHRCFSRTAALGGLAASTATAFLF